MQNVHIQDLDKLQQPTDKFSLALTAETWALYDGTVDRLGQMLDALIQPAQLHSLSASRVTHQCALLSNKHDDTITVSETDVQVKLTSQRDTYSRKSEDKELGHVARFRAYAEFPHKTEKQCTNDKSMRLNGTTEYFPGQRLL
jgi:hypothetical protein